MKLIFKKKSLIFLISICFSLYSLNLLDTDFYLNTPIDLKSLNYTHSTEHGTISSSTVAHENHAIVTYTFDNNATGEQGSGSFIIHYDSISNDNNGNAFGCQLPIYSDSPQSSNINTETTDHLDNHLKDYAIEQRRQEMQENLPILQKTLSLEKITTYKELEVILSAPNIRSHFQQLLFSFTYQLQEKACSFSMPGTLIKMQAKIDFVNAILSGKITELLKQINHADLASAENACKELQQLWPWEHKHSFLDGKYKTEELTFLNKLHINLIKMGEIDLVTRPDYIAKYAQDQSLETIQEHHQRCILSQQQANLGELYKELKSLQRQVYKNRKKENSVNIIRLGITRKIFDHPITNILKTIAHAPSLQEAHNALEFLEKEIRTQVEQKNIPLTRVMLIEQYGYDVLQVAHALYKSRSDYIHVPENQTYFSNSAQSILFNIKNKPLPMAHAELIHLQTQISDAFAERNITDPIEQKELIIHSFGGNIASDAFAAYQQKPDFFNLTKLFVPIDVPAKTAETLHYSSDYESVFNDFKIITDQVLDNAHLCQLESLPQIENQLLKSLHVMREPKNNAEFIFHATIADHLLTDLQSQSHAIATATPTIWQKTSEAFLHGMWTFLSRLNPITQATDVASLVINRLVTIAKDPIGETQKSIATTLYIIDFISTFGRLTSDTVYGLHYLSTQECQQRIGRYCQNIVILGHVIDKSAETVTAKDVSGAVGHILGDIFSAKIISTTATFLRQIDAFGKISQEAKAITQSIKTAIEEHPAYAAAEGAVLKMNNGMKNAGNAIKESAVIKNIINANKVLLESAYAPIAAELEIAIDAIIIAIENGKIKIPKGFAEINYKNIKIAYKHILGMEVELTKKGNLDIKGFHHDFKYAMENKDVLKFTKKTFNEYGYYTAELFMDSLPPTRKTFFPADWSQEKVISKICEAYENFLNSGAVPLEKGGKYMLDGVTNEGITIRMFITKNGHMTTAYPKL